MNNTIITIIICHIVKHVITCPVNGSRGTHAHGLEVSENGDN